ncbi:MAG: hypothetical protein Q9227_005928 [Pyrenula ochraceoflavens]
MAIIGLFEVKIRVKGNDLKEHDDPNHEGSQRLSRCAKLVESMTEGHFTIVLRILPSYKWPSHRLLSWSVQVDGQEERLMTLDCTGYNPQDGFQQSVLEQPFKSNDNTEYKFKHRFSEFPFSEDSPTGRDRFVSQLSQAPLGQALSHLDHASVPGTNPKEPRRSHITSLDTPFPTRKIESLYHTDLSFGPPIATFNFKHVQAEVLQLQPAIRCNLSTVPLEERDVESLNDSELRILVQKYKAKVSATENLIQEPSPDVMQVVEEEVNEEEVVVDEEEQEEEEDDHMTPLLDRLSSRSIGPAAVTEHDDSPPTLTSIPEGTSLPSLHDPGSSLKRKHDDTPTPPPRISLPTQKRKLEPTYYSSALRFTPDQVLSGRAPARRKPDLGPESPSKARKLSGEKSKEVSKHTRN